MNSLEDITPSIHFVRTYDLFVTQCWTLHELSCCSQNPEVLCLPVLYTDVVHHLGCPCSVQERRHCRLFFLPLLQIQVPYHLRAVTLGFMMVKSSAGVTSSGVMTLQNCLIIQCVHLAWIEIACDELKMHCGDRSCLCGFFKVCIFVCTYFKLYAFSNSFLCYRSDLASDHLQIQLRVSFISPLFISLVTPHQCSLSRTKKPWSSLLLSIPYLCSISKIPVINLILSCLPAIVQEKWFGAHSFVSLILWLKSASA